MRTLPLDDLPVVGALHAQHTPGGVVYERLPGWTRRQVADPGLQLVVGVPAGVRMAFTTSSTVLELELATTAVRVGTLPLSPPVVDLVVEGALTASVTVEHHSTLHLRGTRVEDAVLLPGGPDTVTFVLPGDASEVEVWLPHAAHTELRAVCVEDGTELVPVAPRGRRWVHHGSSISHCLEASSPTATWPALVARSAGLDLLDLGLAGQCQLDQWTARTVRDLPADLISLKLGINVVNGDTLRERTFRAAVHGFLDTVRDGHPTTPLLVVTPIVCPVAEDAPGPTLLREDGLVHVLPRDAELSTGALTLRRVRELLEDVVRGRQADGDAALHLLDGLRLFGPDDVAHLPDGLHPDADGYRLIAERSTALVLQEGGAFA